jgi:AraC-like DNA-binding protein
LAAHLAHRFGQPGTTPAHLQRSGLTAAALFNAARPVETVPQKPERTGGLALWQQQRAKELLARQLSGRVSIGEIATACELSRTHFSRAFKASTGQTPHQWLTALRVERAKRNLLGHALTLPEIASDCGFSDQSHFTRVFTAWTGASPRSWQRLYRV